MDREYIQNLRYKLQKRVRRVDSSELLLFHSILKQFWGFLQEQPLLLGIMNSLEAPSHMVESEVKKIFDSREVIVFETELENVIACFLVLKRCVASDNNHAEINIARNYFCGSKSDELLEAFKCAFVETFYD